MVELVEVSGALCTVIIYHSFPLWKYIALSFTRVKVCLEIRKKNERFSRHNPTTGDSCLIFNKTLVHGWHETGHAGFIFWLVELYTVQ